jgi:NAD-dependent dihydropyrimidine dehydrogenase PreA subunit
MAVLVNKKRCDNAKECSCIGECSTGAFTWNDKANSIAVDNSLCINCRQCVIACEAGAVKVARTYEEYQEIKNEYDEDIMTIEKLFQDRFGASLVDEKYSLKLKNLDDLIRNAEKSLLIEFYNQDEARCLINSIPIKEIQEAINSPCSYRKINISNIDEVKKYNVDGLPALIYISNKKGIVKKYIGFVDVSEKKNYLDKIHNDLYVMIEKMEA